MKAVEERSETDIAVIGVGCRFPGDINSLAELWQTLLLERSVISDLPPQGRFAAAESPQDDEAPPGGSYPLAGGFLSDIDSFDADYFGVTPEEAAAADPRQRLVLEVAVEAIDDAGMDPAALAGTDTAVFISSSAQNDIADRLSYQYGLRGRSLTIDSPHSPALLAVHQACEAIRSGACPLALAGGVNLLLSPSEYAALAEAGVLSKTGRCQPFSAFADGFVRSEGAGVVLLKPLRTALRDGDRVHGVIVASGASGTNMDSRRARGLSHPGLETQSMLLAQVYRQAGVAPRDLVYFEAHGTGTPDGDPVECSAVGTTLSAERDGRPLPLGSVTGNLGHAEAASGLSGLLKGMLVLREGLIPPTTGALPPNPDIDFAGLGLQVVHKPERVQVGPRAAVGVNSFGLGGADCHIVLGTAPGRAGAAGAAGADAAERVSAPGLLPMLVSARTQEAAVEAAQSLAAHLREQQQHDGSGWYDTAFTTCLRRARHPHRFAVLAENADDAATLLCRRAEAGPARRSVQQGRIAFVFAGNGSQWAGMGARLLAEDEDFRDGVERADAVLTALLGWSVTDMLAGEPEGQPIERTEIAQPLLFAVQVGLVTALHARGVAPAAAFGHSVGEIAAAWTAGALDLETAGRVVVARSSAQAATAGAGAMAAVGLSRTQIEDRLAALGLPNAVTVAAVNSDADVTVAGDAEALARLGEQSATDDFFYRKLDLDYAFHSPAMDPIEDTFAAALGRVAASETRIPLVSTVTGARVEGPELDAAYWWRNVRRPVLFGPAASAALDTEGCDIFVEVGPHPVLAGYLRKLATGECAILSTLSRQDAGRDALDTAVASVMEAGGAVDWRHYFPRDGKVVSLPSYPWQRQRHRAGEPA
jgi:acyl transferase domain-containing protein